MICQHCNQAIRIADSADRLVCFNCQDTQLQDQNEVINAYRRQLTNLEEQVANLTNSEENTHWQEQIQQLQGQLDISSASIRNLEAAVQADQEEIHQLRPVRQQLTNLQSQVSQLRNEIQTHLAKIADLTNQLTTKTEELATEQANTQDLQSRLATIQQEKAAKENLLIEKEAELARTIQEGRTSTANLRREITDLQTQLTTLRTQQAEQLSQLNANLQTTQQRLTEQIQTNQTTLANLQAKEKAVQQLENNLANSEQTLRESQATNQQALQTISQLENQLLTKEQLINQREQEIHYEREQKESLQTEKHNLSLKISKLEGTNQRILTAFNSQLKELNILFDPAAEHYTQPIEFTGLKALISQFIQTSQQKEQAWAKQKQALEKELGQEKRERQQEVTNLQQAIEDKNQRILALSADKQELLTKTAALSQSLQTEQENNQSLIKLQEESEQQIQQLLTESKLKKADQGRLQLLQTRTKIKRDQYLKERTETQQQLQLDHFNYQALIKQIQQELKDCQETIQQMKNQQKAHLQTDINFIERILADHE